MQKKFNIKNKKKIFINYCNTKFLTLKVLYILLTKILYNLKNSFLYANIDLNLNFLL